MARSTSPFVRHVTNPLYRKWRDMTDRCTRKSRMDFKYYGGRGIKVCKRWQRFENFVIDMGPTYARGLSLDRKNNDKGYSPKNCHWTTHKEQCRNRRSNRRLIDPETGEAFTVVELSEKYNLPQTTINSRLNILGLTDFKAIVAPSRPLFGITKQ